MARRTIALGALITATAVAHASPSVDAFARTDPCDELSLARAAEALGDVALAAALRAERYQALLAIRASAHARAPELLIPILAEHACGRDPTLASEAAAVLRRLAERLTPSELAQREVLRRDLEQAGSALRCAHAPLPDIAKSLHEVATALTD